MPAPTRGEGWAERLSERAATERERETEINNSMFIIYIYIYEDGHRWI